MKVEVVTASRVEEKLIARDIRHERHHRPGHRAGGVSHDPRGARQGARASSRRARPRGSWWAPAAWWRTATITSCCSIDGHPQNSIVAHGFQQQDQIPALEKVERIEIIRGPGVGAVGRQRGPRHHQRGDQGRAAEGEKAVRVSSGLRRRGRLVDGQPAERHPHGGRERRDLARATGQADGYNTPDGPNVKFPWGASTNLWPRLDAQYPGFELYLKLKDGDRQQILARVVQTSVPYPWDSWSYDPSGGVRPGSELRMRRAYLDYQTTQVYGDRFKIQYTLYGDMLLQNRFPLQRDSDQTPALDTRWIEDQSREELAFGAEGTCQLPVQRRPRASLRCEVRAHDRRAQPRLPLRYRNEPAYGAGRRARSRCRSWTFRRVTTTTSRCMPKIGVSFNGHKTDVFAGLRADHNDWRENRTVVLPRAGIIHSALAAPDGEVHLQYRLSAAERRVLEVRRQVLSRSLQDDRRRQRRRIDPSRCGRTTCSSRSPTRATIWSGRCSTWPSTISSAGRRSSISATATWARRIRTGASWRPGTSSAPTSR